MTNREAKIFCSMAHARSDRTPAFHRLQEYRQHDRVGPFDRFHRQSAVEAVRLARVAAAQCVGLLNSAVAGALFPPGIRCVMETLLFSEQIENESSHENGRNAFSKSP